MATIGALILVGVGGMVWFFVLAAGTPGTADAPTAGPQKAATRFALWLVPGALVVSLILVNSGRLWLGLGTAALPLAAALMLVAMLALSLRGKG